MKVVLSAKFNGGVDGYEQSELANVESGVYYLCITPAEKYYSVYEYYFVVDYAAEPKNSYVNYKEYDAKSKISRYGCSSTLREENFNHEIENIFDGKIESCWCEGVDGVGIGEYIEITFKESILVSELDIFNGYSKNEKSYVNNGKLNSARLYYDGGYMDVDFKSLKWADINGDKYTDRFKFTTPIETSFIKIEITDAVKGAKFVDTCISEVGILAVS